MVKLSQIDPVVFIVGFVVALLLLTPLLGRQFGRFFEEIFDFIGGFLEAVAGLAVSAKDWAWRQGKLRVGRHVTPAEAARSATPPTSATPDGAWPGVEAEPYPALHLAPDANRYPGAGTGTYSAADASPLAAGSDDGPAADAASVASAGPTQAAAQAAAAQAATAHEPAAWAVDAIVTEIVYLALIVAVSIADLVFSAERIALVLFKQPGVNFGPFNVLRDMGAGLAGVLFVGISLLAGMLVFDFLDVLPRGAQLFPTMKPELRRPMLIVSLVVLGLAATSAAALFVLGQLALDNSATATIVQYPFFEALLSVVLVLALVGVVALGGWGAIRGIGAILTIALGLLGVVAALVDKALLVLAAILRLIGQTGNDMLDEVYWLFHQDVSRNQGEQPGQLSQQGSRLTLIGLGQHSSDFAAQLAGEIGQLGGASHLLGVGVYAQDHHTYQRAIGLLRRAHVLGAGPRGPKDLSVKPTERYPQHLLAHKVESLYADADPGSQRSPMPRHTVWVIDVEEGGPEGNLAESTIAMLREWQQRPRPPVPGLSATVICLMPNHLPAELAESGVFDELASMARPAQYAPDGPATQSAPPAPGTPSAVTTPLARSAWSARVVRPTGRGEGLTVTPSILLLRDVDPANGSVGRETARALFVRSLAASLVATRQRDNHGLLKILMRVRARGYPFAALSADAVGVAAAQPRTGFRGWLDRRRGVRVRPFQGSVSGSVEDLSGSLLQGEGVSSVRVKPDRTVHPPVAALCLPPLPAGSADAADFRNEITNWFADPDHAVPLVDILADSHVEGVDVSREQHRIGVHTDRYCQVAYVYGMEDVATALRQRPAGEPAFAPAAPWGTGSRGGPDQPGESGAPGAAAEPLRRFGQPVRAGVAHAPAQADRVQDRT